MDINNNKPDHQELAAQANHLSDAHQGVLRDIAARMRGTGRLQTLMRFLWKRGVRVLFTGPGTTGKALATKQLAAELRCDVQRIDLSAVATKYIGETEKNLGRIFDAAERGRVLLFFDEADVLFGKRTEVKNSHDRFANAEINFLLQRMEAFNGLAILATNHAAPIDEAFTRRLQFVVNFPIPSPGDRKKIWEQVFPAGAPSSGSTGPQSLSPGVYVEEVRAKESRSISGIETSITAFLGTAGQGPVGAAQRVLSWSDFPRIYGAAAVGSHLSAAVQGYFENGGKKCIVLRVAEAGTDDDFISGLAVLRNVELNILCAPGIVSERVQQALLDHCEELRDRFCILDSPKGATVSDVLKKRRSLSSVHGCGALYYPWILVPGAGESVPPSGHIAGAYARTDDQRGVHKAPAGAEAVLAGAKETELAITEGNQDELNPNGINCIRNFPGRGILVWGARTLAEASSERKYVNVRRTMIYLEQSIQRGVQWAVFEPNTDATWKAVRQSIENFLLGYWRSGALAGIKPEQAFFVQCDATTTTSADIAEGRMICAIGVALMRPAEFIILSIQLKSPPA